MELYSNLRVIRKHIWLVVLTTLVAAASAAVVDRIRHAPNTYISTATLSINQNVPNRRILQYYSNLDPANRTATIDINTLAATYDLYLSLPVFTDKAVQVGHLPMSGGQLAKETTTQLVPGTVFYRISVTDRDPQVAYRAAQAEAKTFVQIDQEALAAQSTGFTDPVAQKNKTFWTGQIQYVRGQLSALYSDPTKSNKEKVKQAIALNKKLALYQSELSQTAGTPPPAQSQTQELAPAATLESVLPPEVLLRSVIIRNIILFAALGGLLIGIALALLREYLDASLRTADEVMEGVSLPVLATINRFRGRRFGGPIAIAPPRQAMRTKDGTVAPALVTVQQPFDAGSEGFRNLRTGILFTSAVRDVRTIVVTSATRAEGKSVVAANLAIVMAQAGERVILVDADLRSPVQQALFNLPNTRGLSTLYLNEQGEMDEALPSVLQRTAIPTLRVLSTGVLPPNPAELLASTRTRVLIEALKQQADVVIFDTPAMSLLTDAVILAAQADGTVMVVRAHKTRRDRIKAAVSKLTAVNARILGVVLNMADADGARQARGYRRDVREPIQGKPAGAESTAAIAMLGPARDDAVRPVTPGVEGTK